MKLWPLAFDSWGEGEVEAACAVIRSRKITMGEKVFAFESAFAEHLGVRHAVMVNSGSSANLLAIAAMVEVGRIKPGDEAVVPAIAWPTTYAPLRQHGIRLVVVDVDPITLNALIDEYRRAIGPKTRLLVGASILGNPADVDLLRVLADSLGISMLEDNCESLGAQVAGRWTGTCGHVGTFSFFFSHHLSTGEGGMLVTDDDEIHQMALCLRAHGWTRDIPGSISRGPFDSPYRFIRPGYNLRPTEVAAAVGLVQLRRQEAFNAVRRMNAEAFHREFSGDRFSLQDRNPRGHWTPFGFPIVFRNPTERDAAARAIQGEWIECRLITGGSFFLHESAMFYEGARSSPGGTPFADRAHGAGLFVGNPPFPLGQDRLRALRRAIDAAVPR